MKRNRVYILCSVLICMLLASCAVNSDGAVEESVNSSSEVNNGSECSAEEQLWKPEYNRILHDFYIQYNEKYSSPQEIYYDLYDLDGNDIPELIISEGNAHAAGCKVYSYVDSEVKKLGRLGEMGTFSFYPKSRLLLFAWTNQGHYIAKWYEINNHEMNLLCSYGFWWKDIDQKQYEINDKSASEEEYNEYLKKYSYKLPKKDDEKIELGKGNVYQEYYIFP